MIRNLRFIKIFKYLFIFISLLTLHYSLFTREVLAVCPVCTVAVGAGLGLSRWLGIDDAITSIWIGGLLLSSSFWLIDWIKKKKPKFPISNGSTSSPSRAESRDFQFPIFFGMYAIVLIPFWMGGIIGHPLNTILGIDKIIFGTTLGSIMFLAGMWADRKVRKLKGKQLFVYQKVIFPVISLVLTSILIYYYGGYLYW